MTPSRKSEIETLLRMADGDAKAFDALAKAPDVPFARAGFMAQQCVEKTLKAVVIFSGAITPKTHDLVELAELIRGAGHVLPLDDDDLDALTLYSVSLRYDDEGIEPLTPDKVKRIVNDIRQWAAGLLGML